MRYPYLGCVTISLVGDENEERRETLSRIQTFDCHKTFSVIANENEESQKTKIDSINSPSNRSLQRSKSENTPLFHDSSSGQLVKLDNFSFDSAPNHFHAHSEDVFKRDRPEINQELHTQGDLKQGKSIKFANASKVHSNYLNISRYDFAYYKILQKISK